MLQGRGARRKTDAEHDDGDIATAALEAIKWNTALPKDKVKVIVTNGWVNFLDRILRPS